MFQARPRSWVMTRAPRPELVLQPQQQGEDLAPDRRVEGGDRLVRHQELAAREPGPRDDDPLALAPESSCGSDGREARRRAQLGALERRLDLTALVAGQPVDAQTLGDRLVDAVPGVERARRVLEDELDAAPEGVAAPGWSWERLAVGRAPGRSRRGAGRGACAPRWSCPSRTARRGPRPRRGGRTGRRRRRPSGRPAGCGTAR